MAKSRQHRKKVRHFHEPGHFHELTFSCYRRLPLLTNDDWRRRLCKFIDAAGEKAGVELVGFVLMPEHIHLLVYPLTDSETGNIPDYLSQLKEPFSKEIKQLLTDTKSPLLKKERNQTPNMLAESEQGRKLQLLFNGVEALWLVTGSSPGKCGTWMPW